MWKHIIYNYPRIELAGCVLSVAFKSNFRILQPEHVLMRDSRCQSALPCKKRTVLGFFAAEKQQFAMLQQIFFGISVCPGSCPWLSFYPFYPWLVDK